MRKDKSKKKEKNKGGYLRRCGRATALAVIITAMAMALAWGVFALMGVNMGTLIAEAASTVTDSFTDTSKISQSYQLDVDTTAGQVKLAPWSCGDNFTDARDSAVYTTVSIGSQCWMKENLNYGTMITGTTEMSNNGTIEKYCYSDDSNNCATYGGLYQWDEAMDYNASCNGTGAPPNDACATPVRGICPEGWHIPSHYEWTTLEKNVGSNPGAFPYDESTANWLGTDEGTNLKQNGSSGFEGLLVGFRSTDGSFSGLSSYAYFWSSLEGGSSGWGRGLGSGYAAVSRGAYSRAYGFSVRCLKD